MVGQGPDQAPSRLISSSLLRDALVWPLRVVGGILPEDQSGMDVRVQLVAMTLRVKVPPMSVVAQLIVT